MSKKVREIADSLRQYFEKKDFNKRTTEDWKRIFSSELSGEFSTRTYRINPKFLYRGRSNFDNTVPVEFFRHAKDLWAPPAKMVKKQNRCGRKGQSLLFASSNETVTFFEICPARKTEFTVMEYKCTGNIMNVGIVGVKDIISLGPDYQEIFSKHFNGRSESSLFLDNLLSNIFKSKSENTELFPIYNLTNAITQIFMNNQKNSLGINVPPRSIGLIYPPVVTSTVIGMNIVLDPLAVKGILQPNIAYKYWIEEKLDEHHYDIVLTHKTSRIYPNGEMTWMAIPNPQTVHITDLAPHQIITPS